MSQTNNIELELRAELLSDKYKDFLVSLEKKHNLLSHTSRLSVMSFGKIEDNTIDIRVRITNGESEVVIKKGSLHSDDRVEVSQAIERGQFLGFVRLIHTFGFRTEVAERETHNFDLGDNVTFSVVKAGDISYVEVEKLSREDNIAEDRALLHEKIADFDLALLESEASFYELCDRLSDHCDWKFNGSESDFAKLEKLFKKY